MIRYLLLPGSSPVKVKPYRYPHNQKTKIEKMVNQMLDEGLIEHSTSPFLTLIILVKRRMVHRDFVPIIEL